MKTEPADTRPQFYFPKKSPMRLNQASADEGYRKMQTDSTIRKQSNEHAAAYRNWQIRISTNLFFR